jgi:hypothetical protein
MGRPCIPSHLTIPAVLGCTGMAGMGGMCGESWSCSRLEYKHVDQTVIGVLPRMASTHPAWEYFTYSSENNNATCNLLKREGSAYILGLPAVFMELRVRKRNAATCNLVRIVTS